jgi:acetyl coenzyme A synthetase (ADP forming)-like protein
MISRESLNKVFNAESIAVIGASNNPDKTGYTVLKNLIDGGFPGRIYPINPKAETILGVKCYKSTRDVPENIDLAVIIVPAPAVPDVLKEAAQKRAKGAVIISGGFREIGNTELENEVMRIADENGIAIIGPNCQGINYTPNKLCDSWPLMTKKGAMAVIAQSGTIGAAMGGWAEQENLGFTSVVALGNKSGVNEIDLLEFFTLDEATKVIALNVEGVKDGRRFIEASKAALRKKPVVVLKPGRTKRGSEAAESHTKSIAGSDKVFDAVCRQIGLVRAEGLEEFYDYSKMLGLLKKPSGKRLMIMTSSGGSGILAADTAEEIGLELSRLSESAAALLKETLPAQCVVSNPLDLTGDATAQRYKTAMEAVLTEDDADMYLLIFGDPIENASEVAAMIRARTDKPVAVAFLGGGDVEKKELLLMHRDGVPVFPTPERAVKAIGALMRKPDQI